MKTIAQVARELGKHQWQVRHVITEGYVERPVMFCGRFVFEESNIAILKTYFARKGQQVDSTLDKILE